MGTSKIEKELLKEKSKKFKLAIFEAAERLDVPQPIVRIWDCPSSKGEEIAHCHVSTGEICISESKLKTLDEEEITNTANHEVAHLKEPNHSSFFHETHQALNASTWKPPIGGIISFSEADLKKWKPEKIRANKIDKESCNYYQADNHSKGRLTRCKYCKKFFCLSHVNPRPARLKNLKDDNLLNSELQEELHNPHSHPCIQYNVYFEEKKRLQGERWGETLDILSGRKVKKKIGEPDLIDTVEGEPKDNNEIDKELENFYNKIDSPRYSKKKTSLIKSRRRTLPFLIITAILLLLAIVAYYISENQNVDNSLTISPESEGAFKRINSYRSNQGVSELNLSDRAYFLGEFLTNESKESPVRIERKHTLAGQFGLNGKILILEGNLTEIDSLGGSYLVDNLYRDPKSKEEILDENYNYGAVYCADKVCVIIASERIS